jgi:RHS repeat-associated protein
MVLRRTRPPKSVWKPDRSHTLGDAASIVYAYSINNDKETWVRTDALKADGQTYNSAYEIFDGLLRSRQKQTPAPNGGRVISETLYDDPGLAYIANSQIHDNNAPSGTLANTFTGSVPASTETVFDAAGRATESIFRVYGQEKWRTKTDSQSDRTATTAAEGGTGTLTITDARGRTTERREYGGPVPTGSDYTRTLYEYTPGGQLKKMTGPDGAVWTYDYDLRGRKTTSTDPDKGRVDTTYNDADQPLTVTTTLDGVSRTLITDYDELGRDIGTWDGVKDNAHQLTKFTYDSLAKGQPTASIRYVGGTTGKIYSQVVTGYDALGRPKGTKTVIAASDPLVTAGAPQTFTTSATYNIDGTVQSTSMPAAAGLPAETVTNSYNGLGMLTGTDGVTDYVQNIGYSPYGEIEETRLGTSTSAKQLQILNRYEDGTRRLSNTHTVDQTNTGNTSDVDYVYDTTGNVKSVTDKAGSKDTQCFAYDGYHRLTEAWTPSSNDCATARAASALGGPAPYWTSWTYKPGGLRDTQTEHKATGNTATAYGYPPVNSSGAGQPHTLTSVTVNGGTAKPYTYDGQGNTTKRYSPTGTAQSLVWDLEGELTRLTEGTKTTDYLYDANGELLIRRGPVKTVLYLAGQELHYDTAAKKFTAQRYYPAGDATAVRTETGLSWMVDDHHGTASMTVDATTQAVTRRYTKPFGEARGAAPSAWPDDKGFLGKPADTDTGLTHVGAREYDPTTGRFLSVDPVLAPDDHESLNGYAYANNAPVTKSDPTGLRPLSGCEQGCSDGKGGYYRDYLTIGPNGALVYHSSRTYTQTFQYQKTGGGTGSGTMTVTVRTDGPTKSAQVVFKKGPDPKPQEKEGWQCKSCWAMGTNPNYDPTANDLPDTGKLATWQKVVLGAVAVVSLAVAAAPVAVALGEGCLASAPVCAAEIAEMVTGGASGGSAVVGGGAAVGIGGYSAARSTPLGGKYFTPETGLKGLINPGGGKTNCRACVISLDQLMASGARSNAIPTLERGSEKVIEDFYGRRFRNRSFSNIVNDMQKAGPGARGIVWGRDPQGGHVFNVTNLDGRVTFLDGQTGNASHAPTWDSYDFMRTD